MDKTFAGLYFTFELTPSAWKPAFVFSQTFQTFPAMCRIALEGWAIPEDTCGDDVGCLITRSGDGFLEEFGYDNVDVALAVGLLVVRWLIYLGLAWLLFEKSARGWNWSLSAMLDQVTQRPSSKSVEVEGASANDVEVQVATADGQASPEASAGVVASSTRQSTAPRPSARKYSSLAFSFMSKSLAAKSTSERISADSNPGRRGSVLHKAALLRRSEAGEAKLRPSERGTTGSADEEMSPAQLMEEFNKLALEAIRATLSGDDDVSELTKRLTPTSSRAESSLRLRAMKKVRNKHMFHAVAANLARNLMKSKLQTAESKLQMQPPDEEDPTDEVEKMRDALVAMPSSQSSAPLPLAV